MNDPATDRPMEIIIDGNAGQLIDLDASVFVSGNGEIMESTNPTTVAFDEV